MGVSHTGPVVPGPVFPPPSADDPAVVSGYRIGAVLGEGALGRVYLAAAPGGPPVALTVLRRPAGGQADFEARFHRDTQAAGRVPVGPHTVAVLGSGKEGDRYWIATAYVPAVSLRAAVAGGGPLPTGVVLRLIAGLAEGLRAIHHERVVHGDLRPAQVLLTASGPRLKGYGLASLGADPAAGGGPVFLAPEHAAGRPPVAATDVFALGQLAAYASIGTAPFGEGAIDKILPRVRQEEPDLNELPGELREIVTRCLIKDPALRPSPAQITAMCAQASPPAPRRPTDPWLPPALLATLPGARPDTGMGLPAPATPASPQATPPVPADSPGVVPGSPPAAPSGVPPYPVAVPQLSARSARSGRRVVGAVGAVAALVVGVIVVLALTGGFDGDGGGKGDGVAAATGTRTTGPSSGATGSAGVYQGLRVPAGYALSWEGAAPVVNPGTYSGDFGFTPQADAFTVDTDQGTLALIAPQSPGTLDECRSDLMQTASVPRRLVTAGSRICVRSADGSTALLTIRQLTAPGAPQPYAVVDLTLWRPTTASPRPAWNSAEFSPSL
jgi:hypothetical protein